MSNRMAALLRIISILAALGTGYIAVRLILLLAAIAIPFQIILTLCFALAVWVIADFFAGRKLERMADRHLAETSKGDGNDLPEFHG